MISRGVAEQAWADLSWTSISLFFLFQLILDMFARNFKNNRKHTIIFSMWSALCSSALASNPPKKKQTATRRKTQTSKIAKTNQKRAMFPDSCLGSPLSTEESRNIVSFLVFSSLFVWFSRGSYCSDLGLIPQCRDSFRVQFQ